VTAPAEALLTDRSLLELVLLLAFPLLLLLLLLLALPLPLLLLPRSGSGGEYSGRLKSRDQGRPGTAS
jgi:hypothetical protein